MAWNEMRSKIVRCIHACADDIDARRIETFPRHLKELKKCKDILQGMEQDAKLIAGIQKCMDFITMLIESGHHKAHEPVIDTKMEFEPINLTQFVRKKHTKGRPRLEIDTYALQNVCGKGIALDLIAEKCFGVSPSTLKRRLSEKQISKWWKDLNRGVLQYKEVFMYCESLDIDLDNELTRYIFHAVFIRRIQHSANCFMEIWNNHPMRLKHNKTPNEVWNNHPMQLQPAHPAAKVNWGSIIPQNLTANIVRSKYAIDDEMKMFIDEELKKLNMQLLNSRVFGLDVWYELMNLANQKICGMNQ
eukprot:773807_1